MALSSVLKSVQQQVLARLRCPIHVRATRGTGNGITFSEPDYLDALKPQQPVYSLLNVQVKSYDFPVLERFGSYVHRTAKRIGLNVVQTWAVPPQVFQVSTYKHQSKIVDQVYKLQLYERNVQIADFPCTVVPIFFEIVQSTLPEGVQLSIHPHDDAHDEIRHIPDIELIDLKSQLEEMHNPTSRKK